MSFKATARHQNSVTVVDLSGRITCTEGSALRELIRDLLRKGQKRILLNLREVTYVDSSGIGELVNGYTAIKNDGGELKMLYLAPRVREMLEITKMCALFEDFSDEQTAIRSFQ